MGASLSALNITAGGGAVEFSSSSSSIHQLKQLNGFHPTLDLKTSKSSKVYYRHSSVSSTRTMSTVENDEPRTPLVTTADVSSVVLNSSSNIINSSAGRLSSTLTSSFTTSKNLLAQHLNLSFVNTATLKKLISAGTLHRTKPVTNKSVRPHSEYITTSSIPPHIPYYGDREKGVQQQQPTNLDLAVTLIDQLHLLSTNTNNRHSLQSGCSVNNKHSTSPPPKERFKHENLKKKEADKVLSLRAIAEEKRKRLNEADPPPSLVRRTVLQASTSELLRCFGVFLHQRFRTLTVTSSVVGVMDGNHSSFGPQLIIQWLRGLDGSLTAQGWQDIGFINPANLVFIYLLLRDVRLDKLHLRHLQAQVQTALYVAYAYMGHEISYPVKMFLSADDSKDAFWQRALQLIDRHSEDMLRLNSDAAFFAQIFAELKSFGAPKSLHYHF